DLIRILDRRLDRLLPSGFDILMGCRRPASRISVEMSGMKRIGNDRSALAADVDRQPVVHTNAGMAAAARNGDCAGVLLRTIDPIGKALIGADVIKLPRGLVVPRAPSLCIINGNDDALIAAENHAAAIGRIDPELMV